MKVVSAPQNISRRCQESPGRWGRLGPSWLRTSPLERDRTGPSSGPTLTIWVNLGQCVQSPETSVLLVITWKGDNTLKSLPLLACCKDYMRKSKSGAEFLAWSCLCACMHLCMYVCFNVLEFCQTAKICNTHASFSSSLQKGVFKNLRTLNFRSETMSWGRYHQGGGAERAELNHRRSFPLDSD